MILFLHKLNLVAPILFSMPDVITLLEKIYMISRTWYVDTDFVNAFFSIPTIKKKKIRHNLRSHGTDKNIYYV